MYRRSKRRGGEGGSHGYVIRRGGSGLRGACVLNAEGKTACTGASASWHPLAARIMSTHASVAEVWGVTTLSRETLSLLKV